MYYVIFAFKIIKMVKQKSNNDIFFVSYDLVFCNMNFILQKTAYLQIKD